MKEYKVIALSVGGKSNKIFKSGDIVTDDSFTAGHTEKLVEQGFLEEIKTVKQDTKKKGDK